MKIEYNLIETVLFKITKIAGLLLAVAAVFFVFPEQSEAAGMIDTQATAQLSIQYVDETMGIENSRFELYLVADVDAYARLTVTEEFSKFAVDYSDMTQEKWSELATTLKSYVQTGTLVPAAFGNTDENGNLTFSVKPGLYLAIGYRATADDYYTYTAQPFMVFLPGADSTTGDWTYSVSAAPKFTKAYNPPSIDDRYITRKVIKVWDDKGHESVRPKNETVMLFCDGKLYDTVLLSKSNNWRWAWDNLDPNHEWVFTQIDPDGYTVTLKDEGITHIITNHYKEPKPQPTPTPVVYTVYSGTLPQTGVLWWPVPVLALLGIVLIILGAGSRRRHDR